MGRRQRDLDAARWRTKKFGLYGLIRIALLLLPEGAKLWMEILACCVLAISPIADWLLRQGSEPIDW